LGGGGVYSAYANRQQTVTIAGKLGSEPEILINMYKELIEDEDSDINVEVKANFGKTSFLYNAVKNDQVDIYPEFTGTVLESLIDDESIDTQGLSEEETYSQAKEKLQEQDQLTLLEPMSYNNAYALAVKDDFKEEQQLESISDLASIQSDIQAGMTLEFIDREDGLRGIEDLYDLDFETSSMEPALRYQAIDDGRVNLIDAYSTDSELRQYHLSILEDDKGLFPKYQGAPLMKTEFADDNPQVVEALDKLGGKITEEEMQEMNYEVNVEDQAASDVAHNYLADNGLLEGDE
ncbi:MAG: glycine/betaine ABC transporter permease, partial [Tetragenococcus halophilus]|nr:glycine/betaine ABC transporter permease [Tetragenococcus halophilus]MDN6568052.1 glycine/betaine ABC transporter permease [Tetragenococcus halophilus]MDN6711299.1 glycine/betaine ABC transporter permease [Tetragenococcus halophilus]MDN6727508.1 glycine/betaine ABC transporter permease [Tetragenococcus halophilus]MDN6839550.1 glycine/betaine ABC transporter permease [Tetragenococcus halophilus]